MHDELESLGGRIQLTGALSDETNAFRVSIGPNVIGCYKQANYTWTSFRAFFNDGSAVLDRWYEWPRKDGFSSEKDAVDWILARYKGAKQCLNTKQPSPK